MMVKCPFPNCRKLVQPRELEHWAGGHFQQCPQCLGGWLDENDRVRLMAAFDRGESIRMDAGGAYPGD